MKTESISKWRNHLPKAHGTLMIGFQNLDKFEFSGEFDDVANAINNLMFNRHTNLHEFSLTQVFRGNSLADFYKLSELITLICLEKLAYDQITAFLTSNSLLDPLETGYRQYSSTETALLKLTDDIQQGMNNRQITLLLQFDFSKAFDKILPSKLLTKLMKM